MIIRLIICLSITFLHCYAAPPRPWAYATKHYSEPSQPNLDFTPVVVPNGKKASFHIVDGVKVFHLIAEPIDWEVAPGLTIKTWGYNGSTPGPLIEGAVGDRLRIYVTNRLPAPTTVHWHGIPLPNGMDGVTGITQKPIKPGQTFVYEFVLPYAATFMYHSHFDNMTQEGMGLVGMLVSHERERDQEKRPTRDFAILLHEMDVAVGAARPNTITMTDFNIFTMNGKVAPATEPLVAKIGDRVRVRFGNLSAMDHHPIHLHGYRFYIVGSDGGFVTNRDALSPETTVLVPVGATKAIDFLADNPGDWIFHCHMTHHTMNQMGHDILNMIDVDTSKVDAKIRQLIPGYMSMGKTGMHGMPHPGMPLPANSIPMVSLFGRFGSSQMGGMLNVLKVREDIDNYNDPGPFRGPKKWRAHPATIEQLQRDGITAITTSQLKAAKGSHAEN